MKRNYRKIGVIKMKKLFKVIAFLLVLQSLSFNVKALDNLETLKSARRGFNQVSESIDVAERAAKRVAKKIKTLEQENSNLKNKLNIVKNVVIAATVAGAAYVIYKKKDRFFDWLGEKSSAVILGLMGSFASVGSIDTIGNSETVVETVGLPVAESITFTDFETPSYNMPVKDYIAGNIINF